MSATVTEFSSAKLKTGRVRDRVSAAEWDQRVALAACYRLAAAHRMTDMIYTHISARVPGPEVHFLINAYGLLFDEITASSLVKVDLDGNIIEDETGMGINEAGYVIHSAVHGARHDAMCVMHTHTRDGIAVSAQKNGLLPISQHSMRYYNRVAYHDYEGVALDMDERERLVADLGDRSVMILRNHGLLTLGASVREAFDHMYYMERACQAQIAAMSGGAELVIASPEVAERVAQQFMRPNRPAGKKDWPALLRMLDKMDPTYKQ
jgi:ribulose-5-phosphate 4-epimerase/fuculose-1-phosphate aldolase